MFCDNCGEEIQNSSNKCCGKCGYELKYRESSVPDEIHEILSGDLLYDKFLEEIDYAKKHDSDIPQKDSDEHDKDKPNDFDLPPEESSWKKSAIIGGAVAVVVLVLTVVLLVALQPADGTETAEREVSSTTEGSEIQEDLSSVTTVTTSESTTTEVTLETYEANASDNEILSSDVFKWSEGEINSYNYGCSSSALKNMIYGDSSENAVNISEFFNTVKNNQNFGDNGNNVSICVGDVTLTLNNKEIMLKLVDECYSKKDDFNVNADESNPYTTIRINNIPYNLKYVKETNTTGKKFKVEENGSEIDNHYFYLCDDYADNGYYLVMEYDEKTDEKYSMYVMSTNTEGVYQVTAIMLSNTGNTIELMTTTTEQTTTTTTTTTVTVKNTLKTTKAITETTTTAETTKKIEEEYSLGEADSIENNEPS
ncbi:MAG: hypothetical protein LUF89_09920 [Ruminococcus sp.]|nr:hypothetical protein [Ruminococcus sp.]